MCDSHSPVELCVGVGGVEFTRVEEVRGNEGFIFQSKNSFSAVYFPLLLGNSTPHQTGPLVGWCADRLPSVQ